MTDTIHSIGNTYDAFTEAYNKAVEEGKHDFFFNGHQFLTSYAKKLIELQIPTTQKTVIAASKRLEPVGFPRLFVIIKILAVKIPAIL